MDLRAQLIAIGIAAAENGILRILPAPPARWADRVLAQDLPAAFLRAFQAEAFLYTHADATRLRNIRPQPYNLALSLVAAPYSKLSIAEYSERVRMATARLRDNDDPCSLDLAAVFEDALPQWNWLARTAIAGLPRAWGGMTTVRLDGEFTRLVIKARADSRGILHARASAVASTVCKSVSWILTSSGDGRVTVAANPTRPVRDDGGRRPWTSPCARPRSSQRRDLLTRAHDGKAGRTLRPDHVVHPVPPLAEDSLEQKEDGTDGLVLGGRAHAVGAQARDVRRDLSLPEFPRKALP
jgi:hypothetical protein